MGLILDSSVLIAGERRGDPTRQILQRVLSAYGETECALSVVSVVELTHGIYRAKTESARERRKAFVDELLQAMIVHPMTVAIAQLAGRIEGEQAARGVAISFEDLIIGVTALHLGFDVATLNIKHFQQIPDLKVIAL